MDMKKILSGYDLVAKGATKIEATLPEAGLKNTFRNNTWLEDKQIQSALEARKHLVEVERIEKSGALSHGEWREDLMLVEVTKKVGGYWQYMGHNVGKNLFLNPEEALFLIEVNCLCLKHNEVKVSLQQAYNMLLRGKVTLYHYKVYAFLSRLGYRIYRHQKPETSATQNININSSDSKDNDRENIQNGKEETENLCRINTKPVISTQNAQIKEDSDAINQTVREYTQKEQKETYSGNNDNDVNFVNEKPSESDNTYISRQVLNPYIEFPTCSKQMKNKKMSSVKKIHKLKSRQFKPCNIEVINKYFETTPELLERNVVTVKSPDKHLIPNTINLNKPNYELNLDNVRNKRIILESTETNIYSPHDEANGSHIRRLRNTSTSNRTEFSSYPPTQNIRFTTQDTQYQPFYSWRGRRPPFHFYNSNMLFQRPFIPSWAFSSNFNFFPRFFTPFLRPNIHMNNGNKYIQNNNNRKKVKKNAKKRHLASIRKMAFRLKQIILRGNTEHQNIYALERLINTYNIRYKTKVRLNESFDIIHEETIVDTIELDDDEGPSCKKRRVQKDNLEENLNNVKQFASRLKDLQFNNKCSGRHRRAFSKLLKTFNKSYNEDYCLNEDYELVYRNQVDLDSTDHSDTDCISEGMPNNIGKKLKNPFNILKRFCESRKDPPTDPFLIEDQNLSPESNDHYSELIRNTFTEDWLPSENDFGRAEIISKVSVNVDGTNTKQEEFLYDFLKIQTSKYDNWLDLKKSYFNSIDAAIAEFQRILPRKMNREIDSIVKPENCTDMASVLKKLSIINNEKTCANNCNLAIDFDVYDRNVKNFRKTNRPTPHFRIICLNESSKFPPSEGIASLHSMYSDEVAVVFAVVGINAISFVQVKSSDLPVYISNNT